MTTDLDMPIQITIQLPPIDGIAEVGIAVGTDKSLSEDKKLLILTVGGASERIVYAAASVSLQANLENKDMVIAAGIAVEKFKLYRKSRSGANPDCDVIFDDVENETIVALANDEQFQKKVHDMIKDGQDVDALMLMLASKITFWQTNHHTGGGKLAHYVRKVYDLKWKGVNVDNPVSSDAATTDVHMIAHWASTCYLLSKIGFKKVRIPESYGAGADFRITEDVKIRTSVFPAGHAKHGACREAFRRSGG